MTCQLKKNNTNKSLLSFNHTTLAKMFLLCAPCGPYLIYFSKFVNFVLYAHLFNALSNNNVVFFFFCCFKNTLLNPVLPVHRYDWDEYIMDKCTIIQKRETITGSINVL